MKKVLGGTMIGQVAKAVTPKVSVDTSGMDAATAAVAAAQQAANNLSQNYKADLNNPNMANVVAGGSAADSAISLDQGMRKKRQGGLASQLGINV